MKEKSYKVGYIKSATGGGTGSAIVDVDELPKNGWQGTVVPNSGICSDIYLNTNLSVEEVKYILDKVEFTDMGDGFEYFPLLALYENDRFSIQITIAKLNEDYMIAYAYDIESNVVFSTSSMFGFEGWLEGFNGIVNFGNFNAVFTDERVENDGSVTPVGSQNNLLSSLISTTPFTKEEVKDDVFYRVAGGKTVPNSGYVEKVYVNTSLQENEIKEIIDSLGEETYQILSNEEGTVGIIIMAMEYGGGYGIMFGGAVSGGDYKVFYANQHAVDIGIEPSLTKAGWQEFDNPLEINSEVVNFFDGLGVGEKNSILTKLVSLNPSFEKESIYSYKDGEYTKVLQESDLSNLNNSTEKEIIDLGTITVNSIDETVKIKNKTINITEEQYNKLLLKNVIAKLLVNVTQGSQFIKKEVYFEYKGNYHMNLYSESLEILYASISGGSTTDYNGSVTGNRGNFIETIVAQTDGTNYWVTYDVADLVSNKTNEVSETNQLVITSLGVANKLKEYAKTSDVNQMIADYIDANFENGNEGEY